jgi:tRNA(Arg) A34 adenosine deaminase TadA
MNLLKRDSEDHQHFMGEALREAGEAAEREEVPMGAVVA